MQRVWHRLLWALAVSLLLAAVLLWVIFRFVLPADSRRAVPPAYTIGVWEGQVAVFEGEQTFPRQVYDVYVEALPPELQQQIRRGVPAESDAQLSVLLEDYTG